MSLLCDPDRHAWLEHYNTSLRVKSQAQRVAVVIADHPLGLPGGEGPKRPRLGDDGFGRGIRWYVVATGESR
jgi:hypothetical protein